MPTHADNSRRCSLGHDYMIAVSSRVAVCPHCAEIHSLGFDDHGPFRGMITNRGGLNGPIVEALVGMRPVVDAAVAWRDTYRDPESEPADLERAANAVIAAVDALKADSKGDE